MKLITDQRPVNDKRLYVLYSRTLAYPNIHIIRPSGEVIFGYSRGTCGYGEIITTKRDDTFPIHGGIFNNLNSAYLLYELTEDETCGMISEIL